MIVTHDLEVRVGARTLLDAPGEMLRVQPGDRIGLVGRNGAGKTTTMRILAGEGEPYGGKVTRTGDIGYLPQDSREGNIEQTARDRVLSARGLDSIRRNMERQQEIMETTDNDGKRDAAIRKYSRLEERYHDLGGYEADAEAARICDALGLEERILDQQLKTLSGGQRRRVELAQILFAASAGAGKSETTLLLDEPTNHLDADSITWLRGFLSKHEGGLIMISHDVELLDDVCNKVWFLDAVRAEADVYNMGWSKYLDARATDEARRRRERANAEKKASQLRKQADKLGAKATKARAAKQMVARAERMMGNLDEVRVADKVAHISFPEPAACGKTPMHAKGLTKMYGSLEVFAGVDLAIDKGSRVVVLGFNGAGKTTLLKLLAGVERTDGEGGIVTGHGLKVGYFAQEHDTIDPDKSVWQNTVDACPDVDEQELRGLLGAFMFSGEQLDQPAGTLSGGEKTRLALAALVSSRANVLLLDEPTNNLDPQSREQVLDALRTYSGAVVLVTHDPGAVEALEPERVIVLPDGTEDLWNDDYMEIVELA
ncbi:MULTISPECIES: ABC-F family ATP-binding cassette domain-containing protein [Corynebacterium]|uniref:ATPase subunit of ABC transporter with duplicated ATPase domains n=1 Tax=Corynebacterium freneyi TaxID=134034 RepID=A0ABS4U8L5_9CORY|nr:MULTISPECIES: ABC-F family ATP-binding cassette domain-containing protein [Corynebacterium]MBP2332516.1 ATPase subunit of ABC transporter with duplicated ATPase domains [Corynebacterium freneyi]MCG7437984.1 ATP-binding cassette domain-containing protein [Corynebacterium freneyi]OFU53536.1 ABC transporter [Corynebacterium sp. HMSC11E11]QXA53312.1 ATP-binding cassette domain-containing protein [Corynebacterium freneyi]UBI01291.1 ATP-binding cassette domain-containing protein [Corynebacterium 